MLKICILLNIGEERERERKEAGKKERKGGEGESEEWIVNSEKIINRNTTVVSMGQFHLWWVMYLPVLEPQTLLLICG